MTFFSFRPAFSFGPAFSFRRVCALALMMMLCLTCLSGRSDADDTARNLRRSVQRLTTWLGHGDDADGWRASLGLPALETQAALGHRADPNVLFQIYRQFESGAEGLEMPAFNDVRIAIDQHLRLLQSQAGGDLSYEVAISRKRYRPNSISDLQYSRDVAVYNLTVMRNYYKQSLSSRPRAEIYYDLSIDEQIDYLEDLEFELPPEMSVGRLNSQLNIIGETRDEVIEKLDALPVFQESIDLIPDSNILDPPEPDNDDGDNTDGDNGNAAEQAPPAPSAEDNPEITAPRTGQDTDSLEEQQRAEFRRLKAQLEQIDIEVGELKELSEKIALEDNDRQMNRNEVIRALDGYNRKFSDVAGRRGDIYFVTAHASYSQFFMRYYYATDDNLINQYESQIEALGEIVHQLSDPDARREIALVGGQIGWLDSSGQAAGIVSAIRARHSLPNFELSVSSALINRIAARDINDARRVNDLMFGRLIRGDAHSSGRLEIDLVDDPNQANFSLHLLGSITSQTHTTSGPFTAYAGGNGDFETRRTILANIGGLVVGDPYGAANIISEFYGVDTRSRFVRRQGQKQYEKTKARSEVSASTRLKTETMDRFGSESDDAIAQGRERLADAAKEAENNASQIPFAYLRTMNNRLYAMAIRESRTELAATIPPDQSPVQPDVALRIHESLLCNYVNSSFAGRKFTNAELVDFAIETAADFSDGGETPQELLDVKKEQEEAGEQWAITFAQDRPVQFEFRDNSFYLTIYGTRFEQDRRTIRAGLSIQFKFLIKQIDGKLKFVREGRVEIDYLDSTPKSGRVVAFKSFLETRLNLLLEETDDEPQDDENGQNGDAPDIADGRPGPADAEPKSAAAIELPDRLLPVELVPELKDGPIGKDLQLVQCRMERGWLYLGWNYVPGSSSGYYTPTAIDTPAIWQEFLIDSTGGGYTFPLDSLDTTIVPDSE